MLVLNERVSAAFRGSKPNGGSFVASWLRKKKKKNLRRRFRERKSRHFELVVRIHEIDKNCACPSLYFSLLREFSRAKVANRLERRRPQVCALHVFTEGTSVIVRWMYMSRVAPKETPGAVRIPSSRPNEDTWMRYNAHRTVPIAFEREITRR